MTSLHQTINHQVHRFLHRVSLVQLPHLQHNPSIPRSSLQLIHDRLVRPQPTNTSTYLTFRAASMNVICFLDGWDQLTICWDLSALTLTSSGLDGLQFFHDIISMFFSTILSLWDSYHPFLFLNNLTWFAFNSHTTFLKSGSVLFPGTGFGWYVRNLFDKASRKFY